MARLVSHLLGRVREILQDQDGTRYPQTELLGYMGDAVIEARSIRPDLFVGRYATPIVDVTDPAAAFPLPDQFFPAVCFYVAARAELRDDEFAVDGRAAMLLSTLGKKLIAGA